jgi:endonuclease YncB( thermonuclease family)
LHLSASSLVGGAGPRVASARRRSQGQASTIDGDTLEIHGTRIRLWGIDAPESDQLCRNQTGEHYRCGQKPTLA